MEPITLIVVVVLVSIGAGFGAGWGLKPDASVKALQAQTAAIEALQEGQTAILAEASKPIVLDAELKAIKAERAEWERRVALLRADNLDRDILDERARTLLNAAHRNDVIVLLPRP